jgi:hypothetical protein
VISVPYDPSSIEYEISPSGDANPRIKVIQEGDYGDAHQPDRIETIIPAVLVANMNGCSKVSDSLSRKKKGLPQGSVAMDKETQPAKVARHAQVLVVRSEDINNITGFFPAKRQNNPRNSTTPFRRSISAYYAL